MNVEQRITDFEQSIGTHLPLSYRNFLSRNDGKLRGQVLLLYSIYDLPERNDATHVGRFLPGFIAIGDDSGGRLVLIDAKDNSAKPYMVDSGALMESELEELAENWLDWESRDFPLPSW